MGSETAAVARRYYELVSQGDTKALYDLTADDFVGHGMGSGGRQSLKDDVDSWLAAFPDCVLEVRDVITEGDKAAVHYSIRGTHQGDFAGVPGSGRAVDVAGTDIWRIKDGKFIECWTLCDSGTLFMQIGAIPVTSQ